jgi:multidrug resistance protein
LSLANWFFVVWQIGCALSKNIETLIVCRLFAGIGGSACITLGAGVVADMFQREKRGMATSIWSMGPLIGPVVGPIAGGFLGEQVSWQWIFWLLLIVGGAMQLGIEVLNKETFAPVLIKWKTAKLAKELGRTDLISAYDVGKERLTTGQTLKHSLVRPALLLIKSPIVALLSLYMVRPRTRLLFD